jgi:hypothetical protein
MWWLSPLWARKFFKGDSRGVLMGRVGEYRVFGLELRELTPFVGGFYFQRRKWRENPQGPVDYQNYFADALCLHFVDVVSGSALSAASIAGVASLFG